MEEPTIQVMHLSEAQTSAFAIADNQLAAIAKMRGKREYSKYLRETIGHFRPEIAYIWRPERGFEVLKKPLTAGF
jgi:hypothetical protein